MLLKSRTVLLFFIVLVQSSILRADLVDDIDDDHLIKAPKIKKPDPKAIEPKANEPVPMSRPSDFPSQKPKIAQPKKPDNCQVFFKGQRLEAQRKKGIIELSDNVLVKKCDLEIRSDQATIYMIPGTDSVESVKAIGRVKINNYEKLYEKNISASGYEAYYHNNTNKIILMGKPAKLDRSGDLFHGDRIIYEVNSGWIRGSDVKGVVNKNE